VSSLFDPPGCCWRASLLPGNGLSQYQCDQATQFNHGLNAATFFNGLVGKIASVRGTWDGTTLTAARAQLGQDDED